MGLYIFFFQYVTATTFQENLFSAGIRTKMYFTTLMCSDLGD